MWLPSPIFTALSTWTKRWPNSPRSMKRKARVVELRYFGGLENAEVAEILSISEDTVTRDWRTARTWLFDRLKSE